MKLVSVKKSNRAGKKWVATFEDENGHTKSTHFGAAGMNDFTLTGDVDARERYWQRHEKDLDTGDYTRAGFLSFYLLWNKPTLKASIADFKKKFHV
jgi:hypothetical protein